MKKILSILILSIAVVAVNAQEKLYKESHFFDNMSFGIQGGAVTPTTHHAFFGDARGTFGVTLSKQVSPTFGLQLEGNGYVNAYCSKTPSALRSSCAIDASYVGINSLINLNNLFSGYKGLPRKFEIEGVVGLGWMHTYYPHSEGKDMNTMGGKFGMNLNFNLGTARAWTFAFKPAIVYGLVGDFHRSDCGYDVNRSNVELLAGITYHFKNSNGTHHFAFGRGYDQSEVDGLNARINDLRSLVADRDAQLSNSSLRIAQLENELEECLNRAPQVEVQEVVKEVTVNTTTQVPAFNIIFDLGKASIDASQLKNVKLMGQYLKKHCEAKVEIKGYASTDGDPEKNAILAQRRADAVKDYLIKNYNIDECRINSVGQGATESFGEPELNRIDVCIIK